MNEAKLKSDFIPDDEAEGRLDEDRPKAKDKKKRLHDHPAWESDYYNDEVVRIVSDYLTIGSKVLAAAPARANADKDN